MFDLHNKRQKAFHQALSSLSSPEETHCAIPFFADDEIAAMVADTKGLDFRQAQNVVGNNVHQDMRVCFPAPRIASFEACASLLEAGVNSWPDRAKFIQQPLYLNDFAVQDYPANSKGIGIHKDGLRYKYLVFIITLSGRSRLFHSTMREGAERRVLDDWPGQLVILKAPNFKGFDSDRRLLHGVDNITDGRLSIGFRHEVLASTD